MSIGCTQLVTNAFPAKKQYYFVLEDRAGDQPGESGTNSIVRAPKVYLEIDGLHP